MVSPRARAVSPRARARAPAFACAPSPRSWPRAPPVPAVVPLSPVHLHGLPSRLREGPCVCLRPFPSALAEGPTRARSGSAFPRSFAWSPLALARRPHPCPPCLRILRVLSGFPICLSVSPLRLRWSPLICAVSPRARARAPPVLPQCLRILRVLSGFPHLFVGFPSWLAVFPSRLREGPTRARRACGFSALFAVSPICLSVSPLRLRCSPLFCAVSPRACARAPTVLRSGCGFPRLSTRFLPRVDSHFSPHQP